MKEIRKTPERLRKVLEDIGVESSRSVQEIESCVSKLEDACSATLDQGEYSFHWNIDEAGHQTYCTLQPFRSQRSSASVLPGDDSFEYDSDEDAVHTSVDALSEATFDSTLLIKEKGCRRTCAGTAPFLLSLLPSE